MRGCGGRGGPVAAIALLACACATPQTRYERPAEGPVVRLASKGERVGKPPLDLLPDGTMRSGAGETRIDADAVQALLRFIVEDQRFLDIDGDAVRLKIHQENSQRGSALAVLHAPTSVIEVRLKDRRHAVEMHALQFEATAHPKIGALQRLARVQRRIIRVFSVALLGGEARAGELRDAASAELKKHHPGRAPFTLNDLAAAGRRPDGALVAHFRRDESPTKFSYVIVLVDGEPRAQLVGTR